MFAIINEDLFAFQIQKHEGDDKKIYFRLHVKTSNKLVQPQSRVHKDHGYKKSEKKPYRAENKEEDLKPINREVIRISAPLKDIIPIEQGGPNMDLPLTWNDIPMSIHGTPGQNVFDTQLDVRCHTQGPDHACLFVIAFPFNGLINPIESDPRYRIYRGFISSSAKPFIFNNHKYRKVMYLVIEVNKNLFNPEHKYHCDSIPIKLESYALFDDRVDGKKKTNHEVMTIDIKSPKGDYDVDWSYELIENAVYKNVEPGTQLWPTYVFGTDDGNPDFKAKYSAKSANRNPDRKFNNSGHRHNGQKRNGPPKIKNPEQFQKPAPSGYKVTVNKHGIRKEVPNKNYKNYNRRDSYFVDKDSDDSIDGMMKRSGMFDKNHNRHGKKNGKRNNKR